MKYTCEKCGKPFERKRRDKPNRFCSRACIPGRPRTRPSEADVNWHIERVAVRVGREFAAEQQARFLDLFTGPHAEWARRVVYKRVLRETCAEPKKVNAAIISALVPANRAEVAA